MQPRNIERSIVIMTGVFASSFECEIILNENGIAETNGSVIRIPKPIPEKESLTWGYCAHESAHIRYTDFDIYKDNQPSALLKWLVNVLEDTRIEALMLLEFPGVRQYFNDLSLDVLAYDGGHTKDTHQAIGDYLFYYVRGKLTGYPIWDSHTQSLEEYVLQSTSLAFLDELKGLLNQTLHCQSTQDCVDLAKAILEFLNESVDSEPKPEDEGEPENGQPKDEGDSEEGGNGNNGDTEGGKPSTNDGEPDGNSNKEFLEGKVDKLPEGDLGRTLEKILSNPENQAPFTPEERAYTSASETKVADIQSDVVGIDRFESFARGTTTKLRASLMNIIEAKTRSQRVVSKRGRRISKSKSSRLLTGDLRIFKRKFQEQNTPDCDLVILTDTSGSMTKDLQSAKVATFALLDCLDKIEGVNTAAFSFGRTEATCLKKVNESFSRVVKARIASLTASGGTPATEAYWASVHALIAMDASKKVVIMVTDGEPNDIPATKNMVDMLRKDGVNVICLGVGVHSSRKSIDALNIVYGNGQWLNISSFDKLPSELLRIAKDIV